MSPRPSPPSEANAYRREHVALLRRSLRRLTGMELCAPSLGDDEAARAVFLAPSVVLSHGTEPDPVFNYANRAALDLFEMTWEEITALPSRLSAEAPDRAERARLLREVTEHGCIRHYSGVRISKTGRRFRIENAVVWNLTDEAGAPRGQAAMFADWTPL